MDNERVICDKSLLVAIADAVRSVTGSTQTYYPSELPSQILLAQLSSLNVSHDNAGNVILTMNKR